MSYVAEGIGGGPQDLLRGFEPLRSCKGMIYGKQWLDLDGRCFYIALFLFCLFYPVSLNVERGGEAVHRIGIIRSPDGHAFEPGKIGHPASHIIRSQDTDGIWTGGAQGYPRRQRSMKMTILPSQVLEIEAWQLRRKRTHESAADLKRVGRCGRDLNEWAQGAGKTGHRVQSPDGDAERSGMERARRSQLLENKRFAGEGWEGLPDRRDRLPG